MAASAAGAAAALASQQLLRATGGGRSMVAAATAAAVIGLPRYGGAVPSPYGTRGLADAPPAAPVPGDRKAGTTSSDTPVAAAGAAAAPLTPAELSALSGVPVEHAGRRLRIFQQPRPATQQGRGSKTRMWMAAWEKLGDVDRWTNPLMGWTSTADPLSQLSVRFPSREAAEAYAVRNGYTYVVDAAPEAAENVRSFSAYGKSMVHQWRHDAIPVYAADAEDGPGGGR
ncbi:hypothetical protein MMPV_000277 [Pyropia vietnamensis]